MKRPQFVIRLTCNLISVFTVTTCQVCPSAPVNDRTIECSGRGLTNVPQLYNIPYEIKREIIGLDLSRNRIEVLHEDAVNAFPKLRRLCLDYNRLWKITEYTFRSVPRLEELALRGNQLQLYLGGIATSSWIYTPKLRVLDLSENPLGFIPSQFFVPLRNLQVLKLEGSRPQLTVEARAFAGLVRLVYLDLRRNNMTQLSVHSFDNFDSMTELHHIRLDGNPWHCDCTLTWLHVWHTKIEQHRNSLELNRTSDMWPSHEKSTPTCASPTHLRGHFIFDLQASELQCVPKLFTRPLTQSVHVRQGANVTLTCDFYTNPRIEPQWIYNGRPLSPGPVTEQQTTVINLSEGTRISFRLELCDVKTTDAGVYQCRSENRLSKVEANFTLIVHNEGVQKYRVSTDRWTRLLHRNIWAVIVILAGGILSLIGILLLGLCYYRGWVGKRLRVSRKEEGTRAVRIIRVSDALDKDRNSDR
ncbi:hypothetical protein PHET_05477 [Paragonimus heterotremus]|uniref:Ig-like domain-containing protein n=1 Tax=Paragonimus heterotremus TaxID=100268 RepID=A0A8J4SXP3_9TREM|nr:hypothetical protein PHET_05477 [Paragonimus heterotremus]